MYAYLCEHARIHGVATVHVYMLVHTHRAVAAVWLRMSTLMIWRAHVHVLGHVCVHIHVRVILHACVCMSMLLCAPAHARMCVSVRVSMCVCVCL